MAFKKILCAVDFSECSHAAMMLAARMAAEAGAQLTLVHVWEAPLQSGGSALMLENELLAHIVEGNKKALAAAKLEVERSGATSVETKLLAGVPWDRIVHEVASDRAYDLVVIGTHGRTGLTHALLGSVAEKVVRHAPCPVLVMRSRPSG